MDKTTGQEKGSQGGRPRSEQAREAVLHAVDDLLVEVGYAAMTMKGIAQRAGVGRQTVYRWWSTKAEILVEACVADAREELAVETIGDAHTDLTRYLDALTQFLTRSSAGAAYRALLGEAQHDQTVADLMAANNVVLDTARAALGAGMPRASDGSDASLDTAAAVLTGPIVTWVLTGQDLRELNADAIVAACLTTLPPHAARRGGRAVTR